MPKAIDDLMQTASQALAEMEYARCEALCVEALEQARDDEDWVMAERVLLPLQEARRQKRQSATDGLILLGTPNKPGHVSDLAADPRCGCIVLTHPCSTEDAAALDLHLRTQQRAVEVLFADNPAGDATWRVTTYQGPWACAELPAPPSDWVGRWVDPLKTPPPTPAHWFMKASEALGDAALAAVDAQPGTPERFDQLAEALIAAGDHEILHQRLAEAAKAMRGARR